jgi:hypothetical protein
MASDASSTGATLEALAPVVIWGLAIIIMLSIGLPTLVGALHRRANPEMRTGEEGIWMLKVQMLLMEAPAGALRLIGRAWKYPQEHRLSFRRYKGRHRARVRVMM